MPIRHDRKVSILDVMGPVMVGPSSSHTAGTARLDAWRARILDEDPVAVHFYLQPAARRHLSRSRLGLRAGRRIDRPERRRSTHPEAIRIAEQMGVDITFSEEDLGDVHPNTVRIEIRGKSRQAEISGSSIGGGVIEVFSQRLPDALQRRLADAAPLLPRPPGDDLGGDENHREEGINIASLSCSRKQRGKDAFMADRRRFADVERRAGADSRHRGCDGGAGIWIGFVARQSHA